MSTHSLTVSGPSPTLAMLRALADKAMQHGRRVAATAKLALVTGEQLVRTAATTALAVLGSDTGYQAARHGARKILTTTASLIGQVSHVLGRGLLAAGGLMTRGLRLVSPTVEHTLSTAARTWVANPVTLGVNAFASWLTALGELLWDLSSTGLVHTVTVRAAQIAGLAVGVHAITKGAAAARLVSVLPWTMTAVVWATHPGKAVLLVAGAFTTAMITAAVLLGTRRTSPDPQPVAILGEELVDEHTPALVAATSRASLPRIDARQIAARLNVEITADGSIVVHGIPDDLPEDIALQVAHTAADAATERLRRILLHRPVPNRDDRRLLTKVAREAVRRGAA